MPTVTNNPSYTVSAQTPETYVGFARLERCASPESIHNNERFRYTAPETLPSNQFAFSGEWTIADEYATPAVGSATSLCVDARMCSW